MAHNIDFTTLKEHAPYAQYQIVDVTFGEAYADKEIRHSLQPPTPEHIDYTILRQAQAATVFHDMSGSRKAWREGVILLRSNVANARVTLLLTVSHDKRDLITTAPTTVTPPVVGHTHDAVDITSGTLDVARIPNLDASKIASGTLADARLSSNVALENAQNVFTVTQFLSQNAPQLIFDETDQGVNLKKWDLVVTGGILHIRTLDDTSNVLSTPMYFNRNGNVNLGVGSVVLDTVQKGYVLNGGLGQFGRLMMLTGHQVGMFQNAYYDGAFKLDDTTKSGWLWRLVGTNEGDSAILSYFTAGAGGRPENRVFQVGVSSARFTNIHVEQLANEGGDGFWSIGGGIDVWHGFSVMPDGATLKGRLYTSGNNANHAAHLELRNGSLDTTISTVQLQDSAGTARTILRGSDTSGEGYSLELKFDLAIKPTSSTWTVSSDSRLKKNVKTWQGSGLNIVKAVRFVEYEYNGLAGTPAASQGVGVIAEEFERVLPRSVVRSKAKLRKDDIVETDIAAVNFHELFMAYGDAIKQLDARLTALGG